MKPGVQVRVTEGQWFGRVGLVVDVWPGWVSVEVGGMVRTFGRGELEVIEPYDCGHVGRTKDRGGCDPGAIEFVRDDGGPWRRVGGLR